MFNPIRVYKRYVQLRWDWIDKNWTPWEGMSFYHGYGYDKRTARAFRKLLWQAIREEFKR